MNKELEEAITDCEEFIKELTKLKDTYTGTIYYKNKPIEDILKILLKALDNSIPKEVIEKKKESLEKQYQEALNKNSTKAFILKCQIDFAEELLKEN